MLNELKQIRELKRQIRQLEQEKERFAPTIASPRMDGMPRGSGGKGDRNDAVMDAKAENEKRIRGMKEKCEALERTARMEMNKLDPSLYSLCLYFYIYAMTSEEVCATMDISEATFYRWKERLCKIDRAMTGR